MDDNNQLVPYEEADAEMAVVPFEVERSELQVDEANVSQPQDNQLMLVPVEREQTPIEWEVKRVIDKRINTVTGNLEYLLEWKNWDGPPTWEPEENCDCKSLINKFEKGASRESSRSQSLTMSHRKKKKVPMLMSSSSSSPIDTNRKQLMLELPTPSTSKDTMEEQPARRRSTRVNARQQRRVIDEITIGSSSSTSTITSSSSDNEDNDVQLDHECPRSKTPVSVASVQSSCSNLSKKRGIDVNQLRRERKLVLKDIIGAVNTPREIMLIVKWHGVANLEKIPLETLRRFHSQEVVDYLVSKIKWTK